jgi:hypothetical protein
MSSKNEVKFYFPHTFGFFVICTWNINVSVKGFHALINILHNIHQCIGLRPPCTHKYSPQYSPYFNIADSFVTPKSHISYTSSSFTCSTASMFYGIQKYKKILIFKIIMKGICDYNFCSYRCTMNRFLLIFCERMVKCARDRKTAISYFWKYLSVCGWRSLRYEIKQRGGGGQWPKEARGTLFCVRKAGGFLSRIWEAEGNFQKPHKRGVFLMIRKYENPC